MSKKRSRLPIIIAIFVLVIGGIVFTSFVGGCHFWGVVIGHGNVYSTGYYDGYIHGCSEKADTIARLGTVYELKMGFNGYGTPVDPTKPGQSLNGSWHANFFDEKLYNDAHRIRSDQLVRCYYEEVAFKFEGATNYRVTQILVLPPAGELKEPLLLKGVK